MKWALSKLSDYKEFIDSYGWNNLYVAGLWCLSLLMNSVVIWFTAEPAYKFIKPESSQNIGESVIRLKLILIWQAFFVTYVVISVVLCLCLPEMWMYHKLSNYTDEFIGEILWGEIYMSIVFFLALLVNGLVVFLTMSFAIKLSRELKRWNRSPKSL